MTKKYFPYRNKPNIQFTEGQKSKGILDDHAIRKTINTAELIYKGDEIDDRFVNVTGDTMTGNLILDGVTKLILRDANASLNSSVSGEVNFDASVECIWNSPTVTMNAATQLNLKSDNIEVGRTGSDQLLTFSGGSDGVLEWKGGDDRFEFGDDIVPATNNAEDLGADGKCWKEIFAYHTQTQPANTLDTVYRNTTGHPIEVSGSVKCDQGGQANNCFVTCYSDSNNPPTTARQKSGIPTGGVRDGIGHFPFRIVVADDDYYKITTTIIFPSVITLDYLNEVNF